MIQGSDFNTAHALHVLFSHVPQLSYKIAVMMHDERGALESKESKQQ